MDHFDANMEPLKSASLGAMGSLLRKLDELARTEDAAQQLRDDLDIIGTMLSKLSLVEDPSLTVNYWMKDVRELSYDMEDCVDQFFLADEADAKMAWISNLLGFRSRLDEVRERYDRYNLEYGLSHPTTTVRHRSRTMYRKPTHVSPVGMETPINQLRWLIKPKSNDEDDLQLKFVSILGVEGVGKSTLSRKVWSELEGLFECKAFVQTAKMPDMRIILQSILSQICLQQTPEACSVPNLIHDIRKHLQDKRYLIIVDDLWAVSVWDVLSRSFPEGNHCSRVITTTTIDDVALASCSYEPEHIFQLEPLDADHSYQLFISRVFGSGNGCPQQFNDVSAYVTRNCGGLPLAIICIAALVASQPETIEHWEFVQRFLRHNLRTSSTFAEILKQVLNLCYSYLPHCLKTCLLYLCGYPENYVFLKDDLVKLWIAEDFICTMEGMDLAEVASSYVDELLDFGLIQRIDTNSKKKGLYYVVHPTVFDFIACKSLEDNFITVIDYSQPTVALTEKIHRLAVHFGSATYATIAANIGLSQVRSITFTGFLSCMPSLSEFKLVRVMTLRLQADVGDTRFSLLEICELLLLRYLQVSCSVTVILPAKVQCLKYLEILEINAVVSAVPSDIVNHPSLLHCRLGRKAKHKHFTMGSVTSGEAVFLDESGRTSSAPIQKFELLPPICSFSRLPVWIEQLRGLRSLEVVVGELWTGDLDLLGRLPALTDLSLYVRQPTAWSIVTFSSGEFRVLKYLKLVCAVLLVISFFEEAVPNLRMLKIGFNAHSGEKYSSKLGGIHHLPNLEKITASIGIATGADESDRIAAETVLTDAINKHPCHPSFNVKRVDPVDKEYGSSGKHNKSQETWSSNERDKGMKEHIGTLNEGSSIEQPGILGKMKTKIVIEVDMMSEKERAKAMALTARTAGVISVGITGKNKERLEVIGMDVDPISLVTGLRKKIGRAAILSVQAQEEAPLTAEKAQKQLATSQLTVGVGENTQHQILEPGPFCRGM